MRHILVHCGYTDLRLVNSHPSSLAMCFSSCDSEWYEYPPETSIFEIQHKTKIHSQTDSEMDLACVLLVSGALATLHVPLGLH